ncbi:MAG: phosphatase PAP2 family protein, partial [Nitrososphaeraceae archaeon]|nr:phosphatase PAP2 family protein [Nitrososphaeraceae archaeon]
NCCRFTVDASGYDHANAKEQLGPCRSSRAMAIVHIAMYESYLAIKGGYKSYLKQFGYVPIAPSGTSVEASISQAMYTTLVALFPSQSQIIKAQLDFELNGIIDDQSKIDGINLGKEIAEIVLTLRNLDGSEISEITYNEYINLNPVGNTPGLWTQDPISQLPVALGYNWDKVKPFVMSSASQYRCPPLPNLDSMIYTASFNEVKALGGTGVTVRSEEQSNIGIYWAYDGAPNLCAPPRLYNQIAMQLAIEQKLNNSEMFRLMALINIAMADAGIASWESKYYYKFWRPITGIREKHSDGTSAPDGNPDTIPDLGYIPIGAPATNSSGPNFTPPFPAYPSGHATFGGALFQMLRKILGKDDIPFTFVSDELNGTTNGRPLIPRSFTSLSQAEEENGQSRIYLGIHWSFDKTTGITMGREISNLVYNNIYTSN